jgi:hypothetical protein
MPSGRTITAAAITALCLSPSAVANIWPHALDVYRTGGSDSSAVTALTFQTVCVIILAATPFAIRESKNLFAQICFGAIGALCFVLSFFNALDNSSHRQEQATQKPRETISQDKALRAEIKDLEARLKAVPAHTFTSEDKLKAALTKAATAKETAQTQCDRPYAQRCIDAEKVSREAADAVPTIAADRELTRRADDIQAQIDTKNADLKLLGAVPQHADGTAAKVVRLLSIAGYQPDDEQITETRPILTALAIEGVAMFGPFTLLMLLGAREPESVSVRRFEEYVPTTRPESKRLTVSAPVAPIRIEEAPSPAEQVDAALKTSAQVEQLTKPQPKQRKGKAPVPRKSVPRSSGAAAKKAAALEDMRDVGDVDEWYEDAMQRGTIIEKAGTEAAAGQCRDAYIAWCEPRNLKALSPKDFGTAMKNKLGSDRIETRRKYTYYQGFMLRPVLAVVHGE